MKYILFPVKFVIYVFFGIIQFIMFLTVLSFAFIGGMKKSNEDPVRWGTHKDDCIKEVMKDLSDMFLMDYTDHFFNMIRIWTWKGFIDYEEFINEFGGRELRKIKKGN